MFFLCAGNGSLMAALDARCAHTLWPLRYTYTLVKGRASSENVFAPPVFLSFLPLPVLYTHLPSCIQLFSAFPFHQVITINHDFYFHLSGFSPLRKIFAVNHYLRSPDFNNNIMVRIAVECSLVTQDLFPCGSGFLFTCIVTIGFWRRSCDFLHCSRYTLEPCTIRCCPLLFPEVPGCCVCTPGVCLST